MTRLALLANLSSRGLLMHLNPERGWELPGGKVEEGESAEDAVSREAIEEVGWHPSSFVAKRKVDLAGCAATVFFSCEEPPLHLASSCHAVPPDGMPFGKREFLRILSMARKAMLKGGPRAMIGRTGDVLCKPWKGGLGIAHPLRTAMVASSTDPSGMSGLAMDVKVLHSFGIHAAVVVTGVTAQGRGGVASIHPSSAPLIRRQWDSALPLLSSPRVAKVGLVPSLPGARMLAECVSKSGVLAVVDTPFHATWGGRLTSSSPGKIYKLLIPASALATPNAEEASILSGVNIRDESGMMEAAERLLLAGAGAVLVKGGHLKGDLADILATPECIRKFPHPRMKIKPRGTGCALSSLIAANLSLGMPLVRAVESAEGVFHLGLGGIPVSDGCLAYDASRLFRRSPSR